MTAKEEIQALKDQLAQKDQLIQIQKDHLASHDEIKKRMEEELAEIGQDFESVLVEVGNLASKLKLTSINDAASLMRKIPIIISVIRQREQLDRLFKLADLYAKFSKKYGKVEN